MTVRMFLASIPAKTTPLTQRASAHLDMIRGMAALAVMIGHIRGLFFLDYKDLSFHTPLVMFLYAITGLGHQAVMVFFVLSGFLIGGSVLTGIKRWSWKRYLVNRFCRLYVVLIPALLLTAALDYVACRQPGGHFYFEQPVVHFNSQPLTETRTVAAFLGNAAFLQGILVPEYGSDSPLWSLANEFWYYILFPALMLTVYSAGKPKRRLWAFCIALLVLLFLPGGFLRPGGMVGGFLVWLLGAVVYALPSVSVGRGARWVLHLLTGGIFAASLMFERVQLIPTGWSDPFIGVAFATWLYCLVRIKTSPPQISYRYDWWARLFSKCSYSLYAVHFPLVLLVRTSLGTGLWAPTPGNLTLYGGFCIGVFLFGLLFSRLTEARTDAVRTRILALSFMSQQRGVREPAPKH